MKTNKREAHMKFIINKMMEKYNVDYDYLVNNQQIEGDKFCDYYTWTSQEQQVFKEWLINYFRKVLKNNIKQSQKNASYFLFVYGLRCVD